MADKIILITGGNSGIGKAAAIQLAQMGNTVVIGCRSRERGEVALQEIREVSRSEKVQLLLLDMSSRQSIKQAVKEFKAAMPRLDVLIHNAADFDITRKEPGWTEEGIERVWATNHIGPVLLTLLLLSELQVSAQGRIITVASKGLVVQPFLRVNVEDPEFRRQSYQTAKAYYQSKLAQVMYTYWLAHQLRETRITVNCIRVGNVRIDLARYPQLSAKMKRMYAIKSRFSLTPEEMARTYTYLAMEPSLDTVSGKLFNEKNKMVSSSRYSRNQENWEALMDVTMNYIL